MTTANKALVAFLLTGLASVLAQVQDKTSFGDLTPMQWMVVVLSSVVTAGAVYMVPNRPTS